MLGFDQYNTFVADDTLVVPQGFNVIVPEVTLLTTGGSSVQLSSANSLVALSDHPWVPGNLYTVYNDHGFGGDMIVRFSRTDIFSLLMSGINNYFEDVTFVMEVFDIHNNVLGAVSPGLFIYSTSPPQGAWFGVASTTPIGSIRVSGTPRNNFGIGGFKFGYAPVAYAE